MSPSGTARRASPLPPEERRCAIIDAVVPLLMDRGDAVTTREIARAAGVAEGTLFKVFADKDELVAAAVAAAIDTAPLEHAVAEVAAGDRGGDRLVDVIEVLQQRSLQMYRLMSTVGHRYHPGKPRPIPLSSALVAYFERAGLPLRVEPVQAAQILRSLTFSQSHPFLVDAPSSPAAIAELFLHGVAARNDDADPMPAVDPTPTSSEETT
ncbi:MAG: TetR/AcrR family transcriptional regulator [Acidimicrobiales bacterium]